MRFLKYTSALLAALVVHLIGGQVYANFSIVFDVFLVVLVFHALDGNTLAATLGGFAAGLLMDGVTGGLYGLFGLVDTIIGYGAALAVRRLVIQRAWSVAAMICVAAALQQALLLVLQLLLVPLQALPGSAWVFAKIVTSGLLGLGVYVGLKQIRKRSASWRRNRTNKIRFSR
jgi:rod shape-determining protein MreD